MPRRSLALTRNKTGVALLVLALVIGGISAQATGILNLTSGGYLVCVHPKTKVVTHPSTSRCPKNYEKLILGAQGDAGTVGITGAAGLPGVDGKNGLDGKNGADGRTLWNGTTDPESTWGVPGDMFINSTTKVLFGPKDLTTGWPAGVPMLGLQGVKGDTGARGLTGPQGSTGASGSTGAAGSNGSNGAAGSNGTNGVNGANGSDATLTCAQGGTCIVGNTGPGGGIVFYVQTATAAAPWRYLEVAPSTWNGGADSTMQWWTCGGAGWVKELTAGTTGISSNTKTAVGKGFSNTKMILGMCGYGAAQMSASYNGGGKSDWFLPSLDELNQLCKWARGIAWISDATLCTSGGSLNSSTYGAASAGLQSLAGYWSSTEADSSSAFFQAFSNGSQDSNGKHFDNVYVRPIRAF
jgi:Collagen triple helix repeat (20 copies)/Protein of unknown function (DUF1566)